MIDWTPPPRASNDNRWATVRAIWPWALAIGLAPVVSAALILAMSL